MIRAATKKHRYDARKMRSEHIRKVIGRNFKQARWNCGISQAELGESLDVTQQFITAIEHGKKHLSAEAIYLCAKKLKIEPGDLFKPGGVPPTRGKPPKDVRTTGKAHLKD